MIEAHPNWPVHADVFKHPPLQLAWRRPIWSDMAPVDTTTQWREDWSSASVVIYSIVTDPTIHNQVSISLVTHSLCPTISGQAKAHAMQICTNRDLRCRINFLWLWPAADHEPHSRHVSTNKIRKQTETTPRSGWWCSHMAGINSDHSTCEMSENWQMWKSACVLTSYKNYT